MRSRHAALLLLGLAPLSGGFDCGPGGGPPVIQTPVAGALVDDSFVTVTAEIPASSDETLSSVRIDGVDLIAALGLTPPFTGAGGAVLVGPNLLTIQSFDYVASGATPDRVTVTIAGLPLGVHTIEVGARVAGGVTQSVATGFEAVPPFLLSLDATSSGGLPAGPAPFGGGKKLWNASGGGALAAPPVPLAGGGSVRGGFVFAAEALVAP